VSGRNQLRGSRGFTLLEMLVASTIMAIAIVGLLSGIAGATRNAARLRDYDRAVQLARLRMNELLADVTIPRGQVLGGTFDSSLTGGLEINWQARLTTVEMPPMRMIGQPSLERIELEIQWLSGGQRRSFTLDAHRNRVLQQGDL
jgi:general secretion pathway protein I